MIYTRVQGGTRAGWKTPLRPQSKADWDCRQCGARCKHFWSNCPNCGARRPE